MKVDPLVAELEGYLSGRLDAAAERRLEELFAGNPQHAAEALALRAVWQELASTDEPASGGAPVAQFEAVLRGFRAGCEAPAPRVQSVRPWVAAAVVVALVAGFLAGDRRGDARLETLTARLETLTARLGRVEATSALSQLRARHPVDRLAGVVACEGLLATEPQLREALLTIVRTDRSENLRLAALETLLPALASSELEPALEQVLATDGPLLVRLALVNLAVTLADDGSRSVLQAIVERPTEPELLRDQATWALSRL